MFFPRFKLICTFPCPSSIMDINFGCSIGFGARSCLKFYSLACVKHSQGIWFGIITIEFFSFAAKLKFDLLELTGGNLG